MRVVLTVIGAGVALATGCSQAIGHRVSIDDDVWAVRSCAEHRVVVRRLCNPAHCRTNAFLESGTDGPGPQVYPIREINEHVSAFVTEVGLVQDEERCVFRLETVEPHTGERLFILKLEPTDTNGYSASVMQQPNKHVQPTAEGRG